MVLLLAAAERRYRWTHCGACYLDNLEFGFFVGFVGEVMSEIKPLYDDEYLALLFIVIFCSLVPLQTNFFLLVYFRLLVAINVINLLFIHYENYRSRKLKKMQADEPRTDE